MFSDWIGAMADQLVYSSLLAAGAWAISFLLGQRCPRLQFGLWSLVLLRLALPPSLAAPWSLRNLVRGLRPPAIEPTSIAPAAPAEPASILLGAPQITPSVEFGAFALVLLWAGLATLLLVRWWLANVRLRRALRQAEPVTSAALLAQGEQWRRRFRIRRTVILRTVILRTAELRTGSQGLVPFTTGIVRPVIFLPRTLVEEWSPEAVEPVLAHEMSHVRRMDSLWLQVQGILGALYFFHPAAWLAFRHLNELREQLCDQDVLEARTISPQRYGRSLVAVLRLNLKVSATVAAFCHDKRRLAMRLNSILHPLPSRSRGLSLGVTWGSLAMVGLLVLPMGEVRADRSLQETEAHEQDLAHGEDLTNSRTLSSPLITNRVNSAFGDRHHPISGEAVFHQGIDLAATSGTAVLAPAAGVVEVATESYAEGAHWGTVVVLDHGDGLKTRFAHLGGLVAKTGQRVDEGQTIALVGSTGVSTGPHLHFEVWVNGEAVDPSSLVASLP